MSSLPTTIRPSADDMVTGQPGSSSVIDEFAGSDSTTSSDITKDQGSWLKDVLAGIYAKPRAETTQEDLDEESIGLSDSVKKLYEGPPRCPCCINWVEDYPDNVKECFENTAEAKEHALLVRVKKNHAGQNPTTIDSIVIQSPLLKTALQRILDKYPGLSPQLDHLVFEAPFECFFHRWSLLEAALNTEANEKTHKHLSLLHAVLAEELKDTLSQYQDLTSHGVIRFRDLWTIFMPDHNIFLNNRPSDEVVKLSRAYYTGDHEHFILEYRQVSWDGYDIGYCKEQVFVSRFDGTCPINQLSTYPFAYHKSQSEVRQKLVIRGHRFKNLAAVKFMAYKGLALGKEQTFFEQTSKYMVGIRSERMIHCAKTDISRLGGWSNRSRYETIQPI